MSNIWKVPESLESDRLIIRPFILDDFEPLFCFLRDEKATQYLSFTREQRTYMGTKDLLDIFISGYGKPEQIFALAVIRKQDQQYVGSLGLYPVKDSEDTEIFYTLLPKYWGKGYATEASHRLLAYAFSEIGLERVVAFIFPYNEASERVAVRLGMKNLGFVLRKFDDRKVKLYGISREEYFSR